LRVLFDTDVMLDLLLDRQPFSAPAANLFSRLERGGIRGYFCATTMTTIHYLAAKVVGTKRARTEVRRLLRLFEVVPVNRSVLEAALTGEFADFEDAVIYKAARHVDAQAIVTRNTRNFKHSAIPIHSPSEMLHLLRANHETGV
jgi:predicted nucleic acid-binding protein